MLSMDGALTGTPSYMPPEIALGHPDVDGRADIYSLGCVAYYLLTGKPVFAGETPLATVLAHVQDAPTPLWLRSTLDVPPDLEALIMECLAKDPAARPQSVDVLRKRLATTVTAHLWTPDTAHAWWERHRPFRRLGTAPAATEELTIAGVVRLRRTA